MLSNKVGRLKLYRRTARLRFLGLSMATSIGILLLESGYVATLAQGAGPGSGNNTGNNNSGGNCFGFLCGVVNKITTTEPFNQNPEMITTVFTSMNIMIVAIVAWRGYKIWQARDAGEEFQSIASGLILGIVGLIVINYIASYVMGID